MSHYDIHYYQPTAQERVNAAVRDAVDWLSPSQLGALMELIESGERFHVIRFAFSFAGVRGAPVEAMLLAFHPRLARIRAKYQINVLLY